MEIEDTGIELMEAQRGLIQVSGDEDEYTHSFIMSIERYMDAEMAYLMCVNGEQK